MKFVRGQDCVREKLVLREVFVCVTGVREVCVGDKQRLVLGKVCGGSLC